MAKKKYLKHMRQIVIEQETVLAGSTEATGNNVPWGAKQGFSDDFDEE